MAAISDKDLLSALTLTSTNATLTGRMAAKDRVITTLQAYLHNTASNTGRPTTQTNY
jgi:hypothetical protein